MQARLEVRTKAYFSSTDKSICDKLAMRILLIEDDDLIVESLTKALTEQHYVVDVATDGETGWELAEAFVYNLILLDVVLPKLDGFSLCQRLRSQGNQTPILLLTAQDTSTSKVTGLDAGADDYLAKPFDMSELLARMRALLRRGGVSLPPLLEWRNLQLDPSTCEVTCNGQPLHLTPKEYELLELFLRNNHRIFSCSALIDQLWSFGEPPTEETVRSHVKGLRQKLKAAGIIDDPLETVYGIGYRLKPAALPRKEMADDKTGGLESTEAGSSKLKFAQKATPASARATAIPPSTASSSTQVWQQAKENLNRRVAVVERATTLLLQDQLSDELRQQAEHEVHKLAGSLGMFGSDAGSRIARAIEPLLECETLEQEQLTQLSQLVNQLRWELQHITDGMIADLLPTAIPKATDERPLLLVIADQTQAAAFSDAAKRWGMRSQQVSTLVEARKRIDQSHPDIVLLDLPGHSQSSRPAFSVSEALAFLAELSHYCPPIPTVVLTEQEHLMDRVRITRLGARRVLSKPVIAAQALETIAQVLEHTRTAETRVLVVDDDSEVLTVLQTLLEPWGIRVSTLDDPLRFLEALTATSPDLVILDVEMPHISGIELCQVVRNDPQWSDLPILFLTMHTDTETMHRVFAAGADDFIAKPIVGPELVTRILNRLERSRLQHSWLDRDALTGVANRRKATQELTQRLHHRQDKQPFCVAVLQVDQMQTINQQYGYDTGDRVLSRLGQLLRQTFHSEDVVGRWGGTEFVIGMAGMSKHDGMRRLSEVVQNLQTQFLMAVEGEAFWVQCTAGVVQCPTDGTDLPTLYRAASQVLRQTQATGGDRIQCS